MKRAGKLKASVMGWMVAGVERQDWGRLEGWQAAFERWEGGLTRSHKADRWPNGVTECLAFCGKPPWEVRREDVEGWLREGLRERPTYTQRGWVKAVRDFYRHVLEVEVLEGGGMENPAARIELPRRDFYPRMQALMDEEARGILEAIDRESEVGRRDYAIYLLAIGMGLRVREALELQVGEVDLTEKEVLIRRGKGEWLPAPGCVGEAIKEEIGRWAGEGEGLEAGEAVFRRVDLPQPSRPYKSRLKGGRGSFGLRNLSLMRGRLKEYGRAAGLIEGRASFDGLRYLGARARLRCGALDEQMGTFLGVQGTLPVRVARMRLGGVGSLVAKRKQSEAALAERIDGYLREYVLPREESTAVRRRGTGAQPGNTNRAVHNMYSERAPVDEGVGEMIPGDIKGLIRMMQILMGQYLSMWDEGMTLDQAMVALDKVGLLAGRSVNMKIALMKIEKTMKPEIDIA